MGSNRTADQNRRTLDQERLRSNAWANDFDQGTQERAGQWNTRADNLFDDTLGRIGGEWDRLGSGEMFKDPGYSKFTGTYGGIDPGLAQSLRGDADALRAFASNGGINAADRNRMRGGGYFDELIKTGGYSDEDQANIRARNSRAVPAFYASLSDELQRQNTAQGGYGPGYSGQMAKLARDRARGTQDAVLSGEMNLAEAIRSGKLAGAQGMSQAESALQSLISQNTLGGYGSAAGITGNLAQLAQQGKMFGTSGLGNLQSQENAYRGGLIDDLAGLLGMSSGRASDLEHQRLQGEGMRSNNLFQNTQLRGQNAEKNWWDKWGQQAFGAGAGIAASFAGRPG